MTSVDDESSLLNEFPGIIRLEKGYIGFLQFDMQEQFMISIILKNGKKDLKMMEIATSWKLKEILKPHIKMLDDYRKKESSVLQFLRRIKDIVAQERLKPVFLPCRNVDEISILQQKILDDIGQIGLNNVVSLSDNMDVITCMHVDEACRNHEIKIKFDGDSHHIIADIPESCLEAVKEAGSLFGIYQNFRKQLSLLQNFWMVTEDIDTNTWVIDPQNPSRKGTYRRICIGQNLSIQISIDIKEPFLRPDIKFLGTDEAVNPLKISLDQNYENWNNEAPFLENLKSMLNIPSFPKAPEQEAESDSEGGQNECAICCCLRLNSELPNQVCSNSRCGCCFHEHCLGQWLETIPTHSKGFDQIFGECPSCGTDISCPYSDERI